MYDVPDFYLVANSIDRYSIGDRTPGLQAGPDGSVTIYLQTDSPGPEREANWLPTPAGAFRPIMRMYQPQQPIQDGSYVLPESARLDRAFDLRCCVVLWCQPHGRGEAGPPVTVVSLPARTAAAGGRPQGRP